ncbi:IS21 family transposase [Streptomyces roseoverticillatus]|uniref:IS21 family transposase n=1 Tax=Streptomyces roseoverticillatus TaxID=66429 RepID=A0ABV3J5S3_9ACTN
MGKSQSKVDLYAAIRRDHQREGLSQRALQRKYNVTWRTVRRALDGQWPGPRKTPRQRESRLDPYKPLIDGMLQADLDAPTKQRHTAQRVFDRLVDEHGAGDISYPMVRLYVKSRRAEVRREAGLGPQAMFVPQTHFPGAEAEVDFGEFHTVLAGKMTKVYLFSLRLSFSGKAVHRVSATAGQEAFFEGHVHAFRVLGGIPRGRIRYDNLRAAVERVLGFSRGRVEADRWTAFRSHWGIEPFYCRPGIEGAHEKGGVEGQIGYFRRNHLVPLPEVASLAELNAMVDEWDLADEARRLRSRTRTVGEYFAQEQHLLGPLPLEPFETGRWFTPRVDRFSQIHVRGNAYSVPVRFIGHQLRVLLNANDLVVFDGRHEVTRHERLGSRAGSRLVLDHYLEAARYHRGRRPAALASRAPRAVADRGLRRPAARHPDQRRQRPG